MRFQQSSNLLFLLAASASTSFAAEEKTSTTTTANVPACTAASASGSGAFYDLRPDIAIKPEEGKAHKGAVTADYHTKATNDNGKNFTLNICGPVVDPVKNVVDLDKDLWKNVSAYYTYDGDVYSIGQQSMDLQRQGSVLSLQYTGGSPCGDQISKRQRSTPVREGAAYKYHDYDDEEVENVRASEDKQKQSSDDEDEKDDKKDGKKDDKSDGKKDDKKKSSIRRKSATIHFLCDREIIGSSATISFVRSDPYECAYFFVGRSIHACASAEPHQPGSVGPGSVFAIIFVIAVLVYFGGGVFYQRTVAHARGWRQLPNYSLWSGIWGFVGDMFVIITSSCARFLPSRRGYRHLSLSPNGRGGRNREDENRLIDQLDEEWDD